jgi:hypothetical protein
MAVTIDEILVGDPPEAWEAAGFAVDDDDIDHGSTLGAAVSWLRPRGTSVVSGRWP